MARTNIDIDDELLATAKARAARQGTTLRAVVEEALRRLVTAPEQSDYRVDLPVTHGRRQPSIDVNSNAAIDEHLDRDEVPLP